MLPRNNKEIRRRFRLNFYQQLQLSSIGSKQWIKSTNDLKEKRNRILIYNFKVYLVVAFCFAVVTLYSMIFGSQNSIVGVLVLLVLMILRQVDFGIDTKYCSDLYDLWYSCSRTKTCKYCKCWMDFFDSFCLYYGNPDIKLP